MKGQAGEVSAQQAEFLGIISRNGLRLTSLIGDLLDIEKIEQGQVTLKREPVDLSEILSMAALTFRVSATEKGLELREGVPPGLTVAGDEDRLTQVFSNLLSNAIKYTPQGWVRLEAEAAGCRVRVTVSDSGIGMEPETLERLFTRFFRADDPYTRAAGGTGLGLAIAQAIVAQHGGCIQAGGAPGQGSWFRVELPVQGAA